MIAKEVDFNDFDSTLNHFGSVIGNENCNILRQQLTEATDDIKFKVQDFSSFVVKNPLKMTSKAGQNFIFAVIDVFTKYDKTASLLQLSNDLRATIAKYTKICNIDVNVDNEEDRIFECDIEFLASLFMCIISLYMNKKKRCATVSAS